MTENKTENDNTLSEAALVQLIINLAKGVQLIGVISGEDPYTRGYADGATEVLRVLADHAPSLRTQQ